MSIEEIDTAEMSEMKEAILEDYIAFVEEYRRFPAYSDLSVTREAIRHHFKNITKLHDYVRENIDLSRHVGLQGSLFRRADEIHKALKTKTGTYFITTAVADSPVHEGFLASIDTFAKTHDASICILPCESITNSFEREKAVFAPEFNDSEKYVMISDNVNLNDNLYLASVQVSAKQIKPITGLARVGSRDASYVFAAPKQFLEYVSSGHKEGKVHALMTTGACTLPRYYSKTFVSKRLAYIADHDHEIGGIIVEVVDDEIFHFRHVQANNKGEFIDKGRIYTAKGVEDYYDVSATLEIHSGQTNLENLSLFLENVDRLNVKDVYLHDVFDGYSINHNIEGKTFEKSLREDAGKGSLKEELIDCGMLINTIAQYIPGKVYIVKANHDEFLDRYLESGRYAFDHKNLRTVFEVGVGMFEDVDLLEYAITRYRELEDNVEFLSRKDSKQVGGREMAAHGDMGQNGGPAGLNGIEKVYGDCMIGHAHTPAIQRGVFRMGTMTNLDMGYNKGPSTWVSGFGLAYGNGTAQLINIVKDDF